MSTTVPTRDLFIDGEWRPPLSGRRIPVINPATEQIIGDIPAGEAADVQLAVDAARRAFEKDDGCYWARTTGDYRAGFLRAIASKILEKKDYLARLETVDCGKPLDEAIWDMEDVASCFEYYADMAKNLDIKQKVPVALPMETFKCHVLREPVGVIGLITPWNYPLLMATWKVAPALAAGCTAILKPSELASVTCLELADICRDAGLPPGVLNVVTGLGQDAGAALADSPVDKIAFTGSSKTGSTIMGTAARSIKPVSVELGGKSPIIIFEDVDLEKAAEWTLFGCFWTNGQICSATSRLLVQESIAEEFLEKLVKWARSIKVSDPFEEGCRLGPVVSQAQHEKICRFISTAKAEGGTVLCGGGRPQHLKKGYYVEPTIISEVTTSMEIWKEEVFGPVLCVKTFKNEREAIKLANDTSYGLAGAVISKDLDRCSRVSKALQAGIVWINCSQPTFCQAPWGGKKRSGFGRELGEWGLDNYLSVKQVTEYISDEPWAWYPSPSKL